MEFYEIYAIVVLWRCLLELIEVETLLYFSGEIYYPMIYVSSARMDFSALLENNVGHWSEISFD